MKTNYDHPTKHRGMTLYLCCFEFSTSGYGQIFHQLFYANGTKSLERKVDRYLRNYYPDGLDRVDGRHYFYCEGAIMVEFATWAEITTMQQLIDALLVETK